MLNHELIEVTVVLIGFLPSQTASHTGVLAEKQS